MSTMQFIGSPNFTAGRGGYNVTGVVCHWMDGTLASADATFQDRNRNTSAHYGVEEATVHQYVKEEDTAYHAGNWIINEQTVGIEHSAQPGRAPSDATYESSAKLIADAAVQWGFAINSQNVRHHYDIIATECSGRVSDGGVDVDRLIARANELVGAIGVPSAPVKAPQTTHGTATVTVDSLMVRTAPSPSAPLGGSQQLTQGQTFEFTAAVQGESVNGVSTWLESTKGNYVWAGGTDYPVTPAVNEAQGGTAEAVRVANVRVAPSSSAEIGGSGQLQPGQTFEYSAVVHGETVSQNGVTSDLWYHSVLGRYVWGGNLKEV